jgi:hypothetical protein
MVHSESGQSQGGHYPGAATTPTSLRRIGALARTPQSRLAGGVLGRIISAESENSREIEAPSMQSAASSPAARRQRALRFTRRRLRLTAASGTCAATTRTRSRRRPRHVLSLRWSGGTRCWFEQA